MSPFIYPAYGRQKAAPIIKKWDPCGHIQAVPDRSAANLELGGRRVKVDMYVVLLMERLAGASLYPRSLIPKAQRFTSQPVGGSTATQTVMLFMRLVMNLGAFPG